MRVNLHPHRKNVYQKNVAINGMSSLNVLSRRIFHVGFLLPSVTMLKFMNLKALKNKFNKRFRITLGSIII
jgi:hypothetical protein